MYAHLVEVSCIVAKSPETVVSTCIHCAHYLPLIIVPFVKRYLIYLHCRLHSVSSIHATYAVSPAESIFFDFAKENFYLGGVKEEAFSLR